MRTRTISIIVLTMLVACISSNALINAYASGADEFVIRAMEHEKSTQKINYATSSEFPDLKEYIQSANHVNRAAKSLYDVVVKLETSDSSANNVNVTIISDSESYTFAVSHMDAFTAKIVNEGLKANDPSTFKLSLG